MAEKQGAEQGSTGDAEVLIKTLALRARVVNSLGKCVGEPSQLIPTQIIGQYLSKY